MSQRGAYNSDWTNLLLTGKEVVIVVKRVEVAQLVIGVGHTGKVVGQSGIAVEHKVVVAVAELVVTILPGIVF